MKNLSWQDIEKYCEILSQKIRKSGKVYDFIYGVPRGGLIAAVILSHKLDIHLKFDTWNPNKKEYLVVDDINDSGRTLFGLRDEYCSTAVLLERITSPVAATFVGEKVTNDQWINFPWEPKEKANQDMLDYLESRSENAVH